MTHNRLLTLVGFSLALALIAGPLAAQEQKKEGRRGGFAGGPMFGMGGDNKLSLLRIEQVQTELKLDQEQKDKIGELQKSAREAMGDMRNIPQEERKKAYADAQKKVAEIEKKLDGVLKAEQTKRLSEIYIQQRGVQALKDEAIAKELKLSEDQTKKVDEAIQWGQDERRKLFTEGREKGEKGAGRNPEAMAQMREKMDKIQKDVETKALAALTDPQKEQFGKMKGTEFKLDRSAVRGGFGGGRQKKQEKKSE